MYAFKNIMIALDLSAMDKYILSYVEGLSKAIQAERFDFIHIQKDLDIDAETKGLMGIPANQPCDAFFRTAVEEQVGKYFPSHSRFETAIEIVEGNASEQLLHWTKIRQADLLIVGRKKELAGEGVAVQQIAAKVHSSILLIPEGTQEFKLENIFIPVNFSERTRLALEEAVELQKKTPQTLDINCHHVFTLPLGHEKSGKTHEEFAEILTKNANKKFQKLKEEMGSDVQDFDYTVSWLKEGNIAKELVEQAKEYNSDLIIMAAKSKTLAAQLFLGNNTKKMVMNVDGTPLLIVKNKEQAFDFWDFFSKL